MAFKVVTSLPAIVEAGMAAAGVASVALSNMGSNVSQEEFERELARIRASDPGALPFLAGGSSSSSQATPSSSSGEVKTSATPSSSSGEVKTSDADSNSRVLADEAVYNAIREARSLREHPDPYLTTPPPPPIRRFRTVDQDVADGFDVQDSLQILEQEYSMIANAFGVSVQTVRDSEGLRRLALPAITGIGRLFEGTTAGHEGILRAVLEAKNDFEISRGAPVSEAAFASILVSNGVSGSRIQRAFDAIRTRIGENPVAVAAFRKWVLRRVLPGAAAAAATYVLERTGLLGSAGGGTVPGASYGDRIGGGLYDTDQIRADLLDNELREVINDLDLGDQAAHLASGDSWSDRLEPVEGSVKWTPNPTHDYGFQSSILPRSSPNIAIPAENRIVLPGNEVFGRRIQGDSLTERHSDPRAHVTKSVLTVDPPTVADLSLIHISEPTRPY